MRRTPFDPSRDQQVADDASIGQSLQCAAQGCPNVWSVDIGNGRLCSWHHWKPAHLWPQITAELQDEVRRRSRVKAQAASGIRHEFDDEGPSSYTPQERLAMALHLRDGLAAMGKQDPKAWARALRDREAAGERLTSAQKDAWREALGRELRAEKTDEEMNP
jgi:hypothetical protein